MTEFTDIHHHLLWGLDDGPGVFADAERMLRAAAQDGMARIIATPHITPGQAPFEAERYANHMRQLRYYCHARRIPVTVYPGAELFYTDDTVAHLLDGRAPTLAGSRFVLVEFNPDVTAARVQEAVRAIANAGYVPVLAHVERYDCLVRDVRLLRAMKAAFPVRAQVNCATVIRARSKATGRFLDALIGDGLLDYVATDAHNLDQRPPRMRACYEALTARVGEAAATALTGGNQAEIWT